MADATSKKECALVACTLVLACPLHGAPPGQAAVKAVLTWTTHPDPFSRPPGSGRSFRGVLAQSGVVPRPADAANAPTIDGVSLSAPGPQLRDHHDSFA